MVQNASEFPQLCVSKAAQIFVVLSLSSIYVFAILEKVTCYSGGIYEVKTH